MAGIKEVGTYDDPVSIGYTNWIKTAAGTFFVEIGTGNIVGPYAGDVKPGVKEAADNEDRGSEPLEGPAPEEVDA